MDLIAKKYTMIIGNEPITFYVKNNEILLGKSEFMGKRIDFSLPRNVIENLHNFKSKTINAQSFADNQEVKRGLSIHINRQLEIALAKKDTARLERFSQSGLVPENSKKQFVEIMTAPKGIRKILSATVKASNKAFAKVTNSIANIIDKNIEIERLQSKVNNLQAQMDLKNNQDSTMNKNIDTLLNSEEIEQETKAEKIEQREEEREKEIEAQKPTMNERVEEAKAIAQEYKKLEDYSKEELIERLREVIGTQNFEKMKDTQDELDVQKLENFTKATEENMKKSKSIINTQNSQVNLKYTQSELDTFKRETTAEMKATDPKPVLDRLGIPYKEAGNDSYLMNLRGESTPSAYITLKNGSWNYKDFGANKGGTIVNVVMDYTGNDFKDSMRLTLDTLGVEDKLSIALNSKEKPNFNTEVLKQKQEENKLKEQSVPISKVTNTYEVSTNEKAIDYLKSRGIEKIPPAMKIITGEFTKQDGTIGKAFGVGVQTVNETGADIHFLNKEHTNSMKTMSFGKKDLSFYPNEYSSKANIFESKMDYAAAFQKDDKLHDDNVIIANGVSQAKSIGKLLVDNAINEITFFNQNDKAGYQFVKDVSQTAGIQTFTFLKYDGLNEYKQDVNDLLLKGSLDLSSRLIQTTYDDISKTFEVFEKFEEVQNAIKNTANQTQETTQELTKTQSHSISR
ncbi:MAG: hypothetical protein PHF17_08390 [Arcobacteraceae bacterium]|nr:hypothetical protein [Arcobacteraceae bacterium]